MKAWIELLAALMAMVALSVLAGVLLVLVFSLMIGGPVWVIAAAIKWALH